MKRLLNTKWTMQKKLIVYMIILALIIIFALFAGIMVIGRFDSTEKNIQNSLDFQMEAFEKDMSDYFNSLAASSIDLSSHISDFIESDSEISGANFKNLTDNPEKIEQVQSVLLGQLSQKLQYHNCSGIFVMLDATVNSQVEDAAFSRTGLYLHHNRYQNDDDMVLFRGIASLGKSNNVMPHRKWRLEFRTDLFSDYDKVVANAKLPMNQSYMLTDSFTLAGTSDEVVFLAVPIVGSDGTFYGVCGYEVSADYFTTYHAQPAAEKRLSCMLLSCKDDTYIPTGLACSGQDNYVEPLSGNIQVSGMPGKLSKISGGSQSFIGTVKEITLTPNNEPFTLAVMIPQSDYSSAVINSIVQFVLVITLLLFFSVSCCLFFSKRYLSPILKGLEHIKHDTWSEEPSPIPEINDLFAYLAKKDEDLSAVQSELAAAAVIYQEAQQKYDAAQSELEEAQSQLHRLTRSRRNDVDPDNYSAFLIGIKTLTPTEKQILDYYLAGKSVKEIAELTGVKETTIRFHNRNIYSKLNVTSLKQLLLYAAMMQQNNEN